MIAVIGWGSLVWDPKNLGIRTGWHKDGPKFPIEFARISDNGRLTLVIVDGAPHQTTYWAVSGFANLCEARTNLMNREGTLFSNIHYATRQGERSSQISAEALDSATTWLMNKPDIAAIVWTGLPSNWREKRRADFTPEAAVMYLKNLSGDRDPGLPCRARQYVTHAPPQIQTAVRAAMRNEGWTDFELPLGLFEQT